MARRSPEEHCLQPSAFLAERAAATLCRFPRMESISGVVLLAVALIRARSPVVSAYEALWHSPLAFGPDPISPSQPLIVLIVVETETWIRPMPRRVASRA